MAGSGPVLLAFVGWADQELAGAASRFEDAVLPLLADHGAEVRFRGRRADGEDLARPLEVHLLWFPSQAAYDAYLADPRRRQLLADHGEVFTEKLVVRLEDVTDAS